MASTVDRSVAMSASWNVLAELIRHIRNRWRLRVTLHGLTIVLGAALLAMLVGAWVIKLFHFTPLGVLSVRLATYVALVALAAQYIVRPLRRRTSDPQVALYLEEHAPAL